MTATTAQPANEWRNLFGVCACLGEDFGFNPLWLRLAFCFGMILSPVAVFATYFGLGAVVLVSRLMVPNKAPAPQAAAPVAANADEELPPLKRAA